MGEARRRGTFEERKAQAIAEGRVKTKTPRRDVLGHAPGQQAEFLALIASLGLGHLFDGRNRR